MSEHDNYGMMPCGLRPQAGTRESEAMGEAVQAHFWMCECGGRRIRRRRGHMHMHMPMHMHIQMHMHMHIRRRRGQSVSGTDDPMPPRHPHYCLYRTTRMAMLHDA